MTKNIEKLIQDHKRLIEYEASKHAKFIPLTAVLVEAYKLARAAAEKYDEHSGIKFSTYLINSLQKLSRFSTDYGNMVRLPENKQFKVNKLNQVEKILAEELGRQPTISELADSSGFSLGEVNNLLLNRKKDVNLNNLSYSPVFFDGDDDEWVHFVYHDLSDKDKIIFEHVTGFGGREELDNNLIAKKLGISPSLVSQRLKLIKDKLASGFTH